MGNIMMDFVIKSYFKGEWGLFNVCNMVLY